MTALGAFIGGILAFRSKPRRGKQALTPMMNVVLVLALLAGCDASRTEVAEACEPFSGLADAAGAPRDKALLRRASEDFCAVLAGKAPPHAKADSHGGPSDGGTLEYRGDGYTLTAQRSLSSFGTVYGVVEGPVLRFDAPFAAGHLREVSQTRFKAVPSR